MAVRAGHRGYAEELKSTHGPTRRSASRSASARRDRLLDLYANDVPFDAAAGEIVVAMRLDLIQEARRLADQDASRLRPGRNIREAIVALKEIQQELEQRLRSGAA